MDEDVLDLSGLKCPLPALIARRALARSTAGDSIIVRTTDPLAVVDIPHMCAEEGHTVESVTREDGRDIFLIRTKS